MMESNALCKGLAAVFGLTMAASAASGGTLYDCDMKVKIANGWISPKIAIVFEDNKRVTVVDSPILQFMGAPVQAQVKQRGERTRVTWRLKGAKDDRNQRIPEIYYTANLNMTKSTVSVSANPVDTPQRWSAKGVCKARKK